MVSARKIRLAVGLACAWLVAAALHAALEPTVAVDIVMAAALVTGTVLTVRHGDAFELGRAVERRMSAAGKQAAAR